MSTRWPAAARRLAGVLVGLAILTGCRVDTDVAIRIDRDGSGTITVTATADPGLLREVPDLAADLTLDDLTAAGWVVDGPHPTDTGGLTVAVAQHFDSPAQASRLLEQLGGPTGPFPALELTQDAARTRITTGLDGTVQITGPENFADPGLVESLSGTPLTATLDERELQFADVFGLTLRIDAPGRVIETDGRAGAYDGASKRTEVAWTAEPVEASGGPGGQAIGARFVLDDEPARIAARVRDFALWALAAWGVFFGFVLLPVRFLIRRRRGPG